MCVRPLEATRVWSHGAAVWSTRLESAVATLRGHLAGLSPSHMIVRQGTPSGARCEAMGCRRGAACDYLWRCPYKNNHHCEATIRYRMRIGSAITPTKTGSEIFQLPPSMPIAPTITGTGGGFRNRLDLEEGNGSG